MQKELTYKHSKANKLIVQLQETTPFNLIIYTTPGWFLRKITEDDYRTIHRYGKEHYLFLSKESRKSSYLEFVNGLEVLSKLGYTILLEPYMKFTFAHIYKGTP